MLAPAAADLIENQQREIEALRQANEGLRYNLTEAQRRGEGTPPYEAGTDGPDGDEICRAALEAFGAESQITMVFEEMAELQDVLCKFLRGRVDEDIPILMKPVTMATTVTVTATRRIEDDGMAFDSFQLKAAKEGAKMNLVREAERLGAFVESVEQYAGKSYVKIELTVMVPQMREVNRNED